jgi:hypothetical protein
MFQPDMYQAIPSSIVQRLEHQYKQEPLIVPIAPEPQKIYLIGPQQPSYYQPQQQNYTPLIIFGIFGLFTLALVAIVRR